MPANQACPHCGASLQVPVQRAGKSVKCPQCQKHFGVPNMAVSTAPLIEENSPVFPAIGELHVSKRGPSTPRAKRRSKHRGVLAAFAVAMIAMAGGAWAILSWNPISGGVSEPAPSPTQPSGAALFGATMNNEPEVPSSAAAIVPAKATSPLNFVAEKLVTETNPGWEIFSPEKQSITRTSTGSDWEATFKSLGFRKDSKVYKLRGIQGVPLKFREAFNSPGFMWVPQGYELLDQNDNVVFSEAAP
jgi:hypothetical protein